MDQKLINLLRMIRSTNIGTIGAKYVLSKSPNNPLEYLQYIQHAWRGKEIKILDEEQIYKEINSTSAINGYYIPFYDQDYPHMLKSCHDAPCVLICKGRKNLLSNKLISITGMRNASANGIAFTQQICKELVNYDFTVCSGGAIGIDAAAHRSAIPNTIAVLPCGLDNIYPQSNTELITSIMQQGLAITETPIGAKIQKSTFCNRNRITAGLSEITCVMESGDVSGSISTAQLALKYQRIVLAVPGHPLDVHYAGNNQLISSQSAQLLLSIDSIIHAHSKFKIFREHTDLFGTHEPTLAKDIYAKLSLTPIAISDLCEIFDQPISAIMSAIGELDCTGQINCENMMISKKISS